MKHFHYFIVLLVALLTSCGSQKDMVYFDDIEKRAPEFIDQTINEVRIYPNDVLLITVVTSNPIAAQQFNLIDLSRAYSNTIDLLGYIVDSEGYINFPQIGKVKIGGLRKEEAAQLLQSKVLEQLEDATINIRFLNYKITVLGEVNRPGTYTVNDEKVSIPEALSLAGDLTVYGERHTVQLMRTDNGVKEFYTIDLTNPDIVFSPLYFLRQNDILYVRPNGTKAGSSTYNANLPLVVSLISVVITAVALFVRK